MRARLPQNELCIDGVYYVIVNERPGPPEHPHRKVITCRRPKGKRHYVVIEYENHTFSTPVPSPFQQR
jgi:hypothetical protein